MRLFAIIIGTFLSTSAFAAKVPKFINCVDGRGVTLEIKLKSGAIYHVSLKEDGSAKPFEQFDGIVKENGISGRFLVETPRGNDILSAGYDFTDGRAFYQQSANGGDSPLPPLFFEDCAVR